MNVNELRTEWLAEEEIAHIKGWDFSHIEGKFKSEEDEMPWDYAQVIKKYLKPTDRILDIDTGGGEFLLSLQHPHELTSATEGYAPNVTLCKQTLPPLGIDFRELVQMLLPGTGKSFPGHNLKPRPPYSQRTNLPHWNRMKYTSRFISTTPRHWSGLQESFSGNLLIFP